MYSIENELKILRQFVKPEHIENLDKWSCYSEDEISAAEKRLHTKLPPPIRDIYLYMADLMMCSGYLRPLELVHWEGEYLGFILISEEGIIIGIKKGAPFEEIYQWKENDPEDTAWEYEDDFENACIECDEETKRELADEYQKYWEQVNTNPEHSPFYLGKMENEPRYYHVLDGYSLFLVIDVLCEQEEMASHICPKPAYYAYAYFPSHTKEYFQDIDCRIRMDFTPLSNHPELLAQEIPMQMVYVHKNQDALLIQADDWGICVLLTKTALECEFLENLKEQTSLVFRIRS